MKNGSGLWAHTGIDFLLPKFLIKGGDKLNNGYYAGQGLPLDDDRLTLSGTTEAGEQQYRIWHDSQQVLVPKGQSTTKPLQPENVQVNTSVFAGIRRGYFQAPIVEFRNTVDYELFDRFKLATFRDYIPVDPDLTLETLGFQLIDLSFTLNIQWHTYQWAIPKMITLVRVGENLFQTADAYSITTYTPYSSQGTLEYNMEMHSYFNIGIAETALLGTLQIGGHELHMGLQNLRINRGSSEYLFNPIFNKTLPDITFWATDINIDRGWA